MTLDKWWAPNSRYQLVMASNSPLTFDENADYSKKQKLMFLALGVLLCILVSLLLAAIGPKSLTDRPEASNIDTPAMVGNHATTRLIS